MKQYEIDAITLMVAKSLATEAIERNAQIESLKALVVDQSNQIEVWKSAAIAQNAAIAVITEQLASFEKMIPVMPDLAPYATREFALGLSNDTLEHLGERITEANKSIVEVKESIPYYDEDILKLRALIEESRVVLPDLNEFVRQTEFTSKLHQVEYNYKMTCDEVEVSAQTMVELAVTNLNGIIESKAAEIQEKLDGLALTVDINSLETPYYEEGEVVRAGSLRRFGVGGLSMAAIDTARGPHVAPGDWRTVVDGHTPVPTADGVLYRSLTGNTDFVIKHGDNGADGKEGQRGKTGVPGAPGIPGVGVRSVEVTENGMAVVLSTGAVHAFNLAEPLAHAIEEVSGLIDYKIEKQVVKLLSKGD